VTLGTGFTGITELEIGPDGNLYILTFDREAERLGSLYRISAIGQGDDTVGGHFNASTHHSYSPQQSVIRVGRVPRDRILRMRLTVIVVMKKNRRRMVIIDNCE
jgi:hypothetical protein